MILSVLITQKVENKISVESTIKMKLSMYFRAEKIYVPSV